MFPVASDTPQFLWGLGFTIIGGVILGIQGYHGKSRSNLVYFLLALGSLLFVSGVALVVNYVCWNSERMGDALKALAALPTTKVGGFVTLLVVLAFLQLALVAIGLLYACFQAGELVYVKRHGGSFRTATIHLAFGVSAVLLAVVLGLFASAVTSLALLALHP